MKQQTDLVIVTKEPFPIGMAATNRILSYAKEIAKYKRVNVLLAQPTELSNNIKNTVVRGKINSLSYNYIHNNTVWPIESSKFNKGFIIIKSYIYLFNELFTLKPKSVLLVSNDIKLIWYLWVLSKIRGFNYFQEKSEKPPVLKKRTNILYEKFYLFSYRLFSGMIVMTNELKELFISLKQNNLFRLPMSVEIERFNIKKSQSSSDNIVFKYCGGGAYQRDGLHIMIDAFIELRKYYNNFEFHIIGPIHCKSKYLNNLMQRVKENNLADFIRFLGAKSSNEIPDILIEADFLIMTPTKDFDSGGFPTKLGEYLATGNPVICTMVSEIPNYLNNTNAILVKPNSSKSLLSSLINILKNPNSFADLGIQGRLTAEKHFTAKSYTDSLIKFLKI